MTPLHWCYIQLTRRIYGSVYSTYVLLCYNGQNFLSQYADGILGMGRALDENAFLNTLVKAKAIHRAAFATCLTRHGGTLSLGGSGLARRPSGTTGGGAQQQQQLQYHLEPMQFTNLQKAGNGLYAAQIMKVYVGDICITCGDNAHHVLAKRAFQSGKGGLLDTGTTDTFFPRQALPPFQAAWEKLVGIPMQEVERYSYEDFRRIPDITVVFEPNTKLVIPSSSYMEMEYLPYEQLATTTTVFNTSSFATPDVVRPWPGMRKLTMRIYCDEKSGAVLGANSLYHYDVLYDLEASRLGLARSNCGRDDIRQSSLLETGIQYT